MSDLQRRLDVGADNLDDAHALIDEAAAHIEALEKEVASLKVGLDTTSANLIAAQDENKQLTLELLAAHTQLLEAHDENKRLREALEWYDPRDPALKGESE